MMKIKHFFLLIVLFASLLIGMTSCKKNINPVFPDEVITASYCGQLTGFGTVDLRAIFDIQNGNSSNEKVLLLDTAFLRTAPFQILTPHVAVEITTEDGVKKIDDEVFISLQDTSGVVHSNVSVVITGSYSDETLNLAMSLTVNDVDYTLIFDGDNGDYASLIDGMYYGTYSIFGSYFPDDSIKLDWRKKKVVSVVASTVLETTPIYTDEETTVTKENGYCRIDAETLMDVQSGWFNFTDVPTTIQGEIRGSDFHMEVIMVPPGQTISIVLVFIGTRK